MEELELVLSLIRTLQEDEGIDLSSYASDFVDALSAGETLSGSIAEMKQALDDANLTNESLKAENWDLSKKITTPEEVEEVEEEAEEEEDEEFETVDDALDALFKEGEEEDEA